VLFTGLMICAFFLGGPDPATFIFGLSHGILYPLMAVAAGVAARLGTISVTTALVVAVVGLAGPYFGTIDFIRAERQRLREQALGETI
jgi:hypothetical protein